VQLHARAADVVFAEHELVAAGLREVAEVVGGVVGEAVAYREKVDGFRLGGRESGGEEESGEKGASTHGGGGENKKKSMNMNQKEQAARNGAASGGVLTH
jgi:hypothetical protein